MNFNKLTSIGSVFFKIMDIDLFFVIITAFVRFCKNNMISVQVILFEIDCAIFYTNLHGLQGCSKGQKSGGAGSTVVGIISPPLVEIRLTDLPK